MPEGVSLEATGSNIQSPINPQNSVEDVSDQELNQFESEAQGFIKDAAELDLSAETSRVIAKADKFGLSIERLEGLERVGQIDPQVLAQRMKDIDNIQATINGFAV